MENHYVQLILNYLRSNPHFGEWFTFIVAFSESLPLIGTIIPGTVTMTVVGILIGMGALPVALSLGIATGAAFSGDCIGFTIGYYYNERLRGFWPFKKHPTWLTLSENFFKKHGGKSIILGRFIGPARSTVPLIAGLLRMTWLRFCVAAIPSAAMWALMYTLPGMLLGALSREVPTHETPRFFLYGIGILAAIWLIFWLVQHFFIQLAKLINQLTDRCWNYLMRRNNGKSFIRFITNQQKPSDHHQLTLFLTDIVIVVLFLFIWFSVETHNVITDMNQPVFHLLQSIRTPFFDTVFIVVTLMGAPSVIMIISLLVTAGFIIKKQWRAATHFFAGFFLSAGAVFIIKTISHSARPNGFEYVKHSSSFPSGHTTLAAAVFGLMAFFFAKIMPKNWRWLPWTVTSCIITFVAFSRLYLGAHWITDIIGALLLGFSAFLACVISYRRMPHIKGELQLTPLFSIALLVVALGLPWSVSISHAVNKSIAQYTRVWPTQKIALQTWWQSPLSNTPRYRTNRLGQPFQPFNVQWQGSLSAISETLQNAGWKIISHHNKLKTTLRRFGSLDAQYHLPVFAWLYHDKPPVLFLIKHIPMQKRILELRLWKSNITVIPPHQPLWLGAINIRIPPKTLLSFQDEAKISLAGAGGLDELYADTQSYQRKIIQAQPTPKDHHAAKLQWQGKILVIRTAPLGS